jgi:hypothetical protein
MRIYQNLSRLPPVLFSLKNAGQVLPEYQVTQYSHFIFIKTNNFHLGRIQAKKGCCFTNVYFPNKLPVSLKNRKKNISNLKKY